MKFGKYIPNNLLQNYIDHMWILKLDQNEEMTRERFMPDSRFELIIDLKGGFQRFSKDQSVEFEPYAFICRLFTEHVFLSPLPETCRLGIVFKPGKICHFLNDRTNHLGEYTALTDLFGLNAVNLVEQIFETKNHQEKFKILENFLMKNIKEDDRRYAAIDFAIQHILQNDYTIKIRDLAKVCCMSERNFRRVFCEITGLSPRLFIKIIKIGQITKLLRSDKSNSFVETAYRFGFHDPSHFHRRFIEIAGITPSKYCSEENRLSKMIY